MARRLTRQEQKANTRRQLLDAARTVFPRSGYHGATLDEITAEAGFTTGAVYSSFSSKADLFLALLEEGIEERLRAFREAMAGVEGVEAGASAGARLWMALMRESREWTRLAFEFWVHAAGDPVLRRRASQLRVRLVDGIATGIAELAARDGMLLPLPARELALAGIAMRQGIAFERLLDPERVPDELLETMYLAFFRGLTDRTPGTGGAR